MATNKRKLKMRGFPLGFISKNDINTTDVSHEALSDVLNVEINDPHMAIRTADGLSEVFNTPDGRNVAIYRFSVELPEFRELICLIQDDSNDYKIYLRPYWDGSDWVDDWLELTKPPEEDAMSEYKVDGNVDERFITFSEIDGALRISFGKNKRPLILKYVNGDFFPGTTLTTAGDKEINVDEFILDYMCHFCPVDMDDTLGHPTVTNLEKFGFSFETSKVFGGSLPLGTYMVNCLLTYDGQKIVANGDEQVGDPGSKASGWIEFDTPADDNTVEITSFVLGGSPASIDETFTFKSSPTVPIQDSKEFSTLEELAELINFFFEDRLVAWVDNGRVNIEHTEVGSTSNRSTSLTAPSGFTLSGSSLTGGTDPVLPANTIIDITQDNINAGRRSINVQLVIDEDFFTPRLTQIEVFIGTFDGRFYDATKQFLHKSILTSEDGWTYNAGDYEYEFEIEELPGLTQTQIQILTREPYFDTRVRFSLQSFLRGRLFVTNTREPFPQEPSGPTPPDDVFYVAQFQRNVYRIDGTDGNTITSRSNIFPSGEITEIDVDKSGNPIIITSTSLVIKLAKDTLDTIWERDLEEIEGLASFCVDINDNIWIGVGNPDQSARSDANRIYKLNGNDGSTILTFNESGTSASQRRQQSVRSDRDGNIYTAREANFGAAGNRTITGRLSKYDNGGNLLAYTSDIGRTWSSLSVAVDSSYAFRHLDINPIAGTVIVMTHQRENLVYNLDGLLLIGSMTKNTTESVRRLLVTLKSWYVNHFERHTGDFINSVRVVKTLTNPQTNYEYQILFGDSTRHTMLALSLDGNFVTGNRGGGNYLLTKHNHDDGVQLWSKELRSIDIVHEAGRFCQSERFVAVPPVELLDVPEVIDFGIYSDGQLPFDPDHWEPIADATNSMFEIESDAGSIGGKHVKLTAPTGTWFYFMVNKQDVFKPVADAIYRLKFKTPATVDSGTRVWLPFNVTDADNLYYVGFRSGSWELSRLHNGSFSLLQNHSISIDADTWYWVEVKVTHAHNPDTGENSITIERKFWKDGESEPGSYAQSSTQTSTLKYGGAFGVGAREGTYLFDVIEVDQL